MFDFLQTDMARLVLGLGLAFSIFLLLLLSWVNSR